MIIDRQPVGYGEAVMRIVKEAQERKNEILDAAAELFATKGYDGTSTNDILEKIGIARGTLYYHFKSKEDILDGMIERINGSLAAKARELAGDKSVPVVERILLVIKNLNVESDIGEEVMKQVHKPQNALMHQKMQQSLMDEIAPILAKLVEEGVSQEIFHTQCPLEATEMILLYSEVVFDDQFQQSGDQQAKRIRAFLYNAERLLGAESGSLAVPMMELFQERKC